MWAPMCPSILGHCGPVALFAEREEGVCSLPDCRAARRALLYMCCYTTAEDDSAVEAQCTEQSRSLLACPCYVCVHEQPRQMAAGMDGCAGHMTAGRCLRPKATRSVALRCLWSAAEEGAEGAAQLFPQPLRPSQQTTMDDCLYIVCTSGDEPWGQWASINSVGSSFCASPRQAGAAAQGPSRARVPPAARPPGPPRGPQTACLPPRIVPRRSAPRCSCRDITQRPASASWA